MRRRSRAMGRLGFQALVLVLTLAPMALVTPLLVDAWSKFDRRHKSDPLPALRASFSQKEQERYTTLPAHPRSVPVLVWRGINDEARDRFSVSQETFVKQVAMLRRTGYRAISMEQYVRFLRGDLAGLPERPVLLTFDDGRLDSYRGADRVLREYGMRATMFVTSAQTRPDDDVHLSYKELAEMQESGRWDVQAHGDEGHGMLAIDARGAMGSAYTHRRWTSSAGTESLPEWEQRVTSDVFAARDALADHLPGYRPLAFAAPYGDVGQATTNDPRIPGLLQEFLSRQFEITFVKHPHNYPTFTTKREHHGFAHRFAIHGGTTVDDVFRWLRDRSPAAIEAAEQAAERRAKARAARERAIDRRVARRKAREKRAQRRAAERRAAARPGASARPADLTPKEGPHPCAASSDTSARAPAPTCCSTDSSGSNIVDTTRQGSPCRVKAPWSACARSAPSRRCAAPWRAASSAARSRPARPAPSRRRPGPASGTRAGRRTGA